MKRTLLCLLFLSLCAPARAQDATPAPAAEGESAPGVEVVKHSWSKERLNWEGDPFGGTVENFDDLRRRFADLRRIDRARVSGNIGDARKVEVEMRSEQVIKSRPPAPPRYAFRYTASFRNTGAKAIKQIDWDYLFYDAATNQLVGRIELGSDDKIASGKKKDISFFIPTPPSKTISVQALNDKERQGLTEQVVVVRVLYEDGTVWEKH